MPNLDADKTKLKRYVKQLQGNSYLTVAGRVFAAHDARQLVAVRTDLHETETHYRYCATVTVLNSHLPNFEMLPDSGKLGTYTGWSQSLRKGGKGAEGTNPLEVAETSALGRALGFAGFGDLESIASYEEMTVAYARRDQAADEEASQSHDPDGSPTIEQKKQLLQAAIDAKQAKSPSDLLALAKDRYAEIGSLDDLTAMQVQVWTQELTASQQKSATKKASSPKGEAPF